MTHSQGFLSELALVPPAGNISWAAAAPASSQPTDDVSVGPWPLFWYEPPWHLAEPTAAGDVAGAVADLGIAVSALACDVTAEGSAVPPAWPRRIIPYRPDRYGLQLEDLQAAHIVDIRLAAHRDVAGRFAYSPRQMQRWSGDAAAVIAADAAMPALHWPPELRSLSDLPQKLQQLRRLAPQAKCFVSSSPLRLAEELPLLLSGGSDGVVLRLDDCGALTGPQAAQLVVMARHLIARSGRSVEFPLWIVPPVDPTADDCVKLLALGATAIAIDAWCNPLLTTAAATQHAAAAWPDAPRGSLKASRSPDPVEQFGPDLDRLAGLIRSCGAAKVSDLSGQHLTTADQHLALQLGIGWLLIGH